MNDPGLLSLGEQEILHIEVEGEHYQLPPDDVRNLLFTGRSAPLIKVQKPGPGEQQPRVTIEGHCALNRSGKAVIFYSVVGRFIIPVVSFRRVARGDVVSAPLFPLVPGETGGDNE